MSVYDYRLAWECRDCDGLREAFVRIYEIAYRRYNCPQRAYHDVIEQLHKYGLPSYYNAVRYLSAKGERR